MCWYKEMGNNASRQQLDKMRDHRLYQHRLEQQQQKEAQRREDEDLFAKVHPASLFTIYTPQIVSQIVYTHTHH